MTNSAFALSILAGFVFLASLIVLWRKMNSSTNAWPEAETHFIQPAIQYYIAGRFAALAQQFPVCANLLHHAVEMLLKGALCQTHSRGALRAMGHNLRKPWLAFKAVHRDPRLVMFDPTVSALNKFERIRYPDEVMAKGMIGTFDLLREHKSKAQVFGAANPPTFALNLEDIDELIITIFEVAKKNPHFYLNSISEAARAVLNDRNRHPFPPAT